MRRDSQQAQSKPKDLSDVFIDLQVLHGAIKQTVTVQQLVDVLTRRGYEVSSRSISTFVRRFERKGWLRARRMKNETARLFQATRGGEKALDESKPLSQRCLKRCRPNRPLSLLAVGDRFTSF